MEAPISFKPISGYEGLYSINSSGVVFNHKSGYFKCGRIQHDGYFVVHLIKDRMEKVFYTHRLVASVFIDNPHNKPQVNHKDGDKLAPYWFNLEWCTHKENAMHSAHVLGNKGAGEIRKIMRVGNGGESHIFNSIREAGRLSNVNFQGIQKVLAGKRVTSGGYKWQYAA